MTTANNDTPHDDPASEMDAAADAAAAGLTADPTAPPANTNRYLGLFEDVVFTPSTRDTVYKSDRPGNAQQSTQIANVALILIGGFASVPGTVYARYDGSKKNAKPTADFVISGRAGSQAITPLDALSAAELRAFKSHVLDLFMAWRAKNPIIRTAGTRSNAPTLDDLTDIFGN